MSKITVTILGTTAGAPTKERNHAAIYVTHDDGNAVSLLFDCGEGTQRQIMRSGLDLLGIDAVFITHWHGDHSLGIAGMVDTMGFDGRDKPLTVYSPEPVRLKRALNVTRSMHKFRVDGRGVPAKGNSVRRVFVSERFGVFSVPVKHGVPAVAYAIIEDKKVRVDTVRATVLGLPREGEIYKELKEKGRVRYNGKTVLLSEVSTEEEGKKVVYSGDTEICPNLRRLVRGADLLIQDCTYFCEEGFEKPYLHASLPDVIKMAREEGVKRTVLTHISRRHTDKTVLESMLRGAAGLEVAEDMYTVRL